MMDSRALRAAHAAFEPWHEALLRLSAELPIDRGVAEVARIVLDELSTAFPELAFGVSLVTEGGEALALVRLPSSTQGGRGRDPARLFPGFAAEYVVPLQDGATGSTFHVAAPASATLGAFQVGLSDRTAFVLGAAVARARLFERRSSDRAEPLSQIVAGVVHELNNPLTSILAYSEYLARKMDGGAPLDADDRERVRRIGEAALRVLEFSRDLAAYARPRAEPTAELDLLDVVNNALVSCDHEFARHGIGVKTTFPRELPPLIGVSEKLTRVFINLFTNAVHAMAETGGTLEVSAGVDEGGRAIHVDVTDAGCGIPEAHLEQIFEPFFTTKASGLGTGLGLAIVRDILDAHGGTISVTSATGAGTTFRVGLPLAER